MKFTDEKKFEDALINALTHHGWDKEVIDYPTEEDLLKNWAQILFDNNRDIDRLNDYPLTDTEMQQLIEQINVLKTPLKLNGFINGKTVSIIRDNPNDKQHFGKEISLKIYDRMEIAAGQSRYQIVRQPKFKARSGVLPDRRGDLMLLINGMPVIHIELKRSDIPVSKACNQIEKYSHEGIFTNLFSLVQIFVAMNPEETLYFANPGPDGKFNPDFFFHWADFNNDPINDWNQIASTLLSIPMAHQLIGFYTVADNSDGVLKVMRSYQYYAVNAISDKVAKTDWNDSHLLGGYIWHTTGSGKTMTSFKSAQLIANSKDADKVVFLVDRIELGTQSLEEYRGFASDDQSVQKTENSGVLADKMKSSEPGNTLIVTSIQKMSRITEESGLKAKDLQIINSKRIVFIVDECHRSTFGDMLIAIKNTFPHAIFFGFTGTPILDENEKLKNTTATVFGDELHRYSIADGIRDKNVLGFDPYKVLIYKDRDLRKKVALKATGADSEAEALNDKTKSKIYHEYMKLPMAGHVSETGKYIKGIEDYVPKTQYTTKEYQEAVVSDIIDNWITLSCNSKFHAIFATSSIKEAIQYYRLFKKHDSTLKISALFDPNEDNEKTSIFKEEGLAEIITDYNQLFDTKFTIPTHAKFKKDIAMRLAHKGPYKFIEKDPTKQIDLLIVVNQMLTGFDSKWLNTLYLDKELQYENVIQAFSRTNRLFNAIEKPFGTIRYYRKPHTMEYNIEKALRLYSGNKPFGLFVNRLEHNLNLMNSSYEEIEEVFYQAGIKNFEKLPEEPSECAKFAKAFRNFNEYLAAAKIQGFKWEQKEYVFNQGSGKPKTTVTMKLDEPTYITLLMRYKELSSGSIGISDTKAPYDIDTHITEIDTGVVNSDYMNSRFNKYKKALEQKDISKTELERILEDLHKSFATLTQEEQKFANIFLNDIQSGSVILEPDKTFRDYITEYIANAQNDQIHKLAIVLGLNEQLLRNFMASPVTSANINEYGRFDDLKKTVDITKARTYFESITKVKLPTYKVNIKVDELLRNFILMGGIEI